MRSPADPRYSEGYWQRGEGSNYVGYGDDAGWEPTLDVIETLIPPALPGPPGSVRPTRMLEVGCASGWFVAHAMRRGYDAWGIDVSEWILDHRAPFTKLTGDRLRLASATDIPYGNATFDVLCSFEMMEHLQPDEVDTAAREFERVLTPNGILVHRIGTYDATAPDHHRHFEDHTHATNEPREWWEHKMATWGWARFHRTEALLDKAFTDRDWAGRFFVAQPGHGTY